MKEKEKILKTLIIELTGLNLEKLPPLPTETPIKALEKYLEALSNETSKCLAIPIPKPNLIIRPSVKLFNPKRKEYIGAAYEPETQTIYLYIEPDIDTNIYKLHHEYAHHLQYTYLTTYGYKPEEVTDEYEESKEIEELIETNAREIAYHYLYHITQTNHYKQLEQIMKKLIQHLSHAHNTQTKHQEPYHK